MSETFEREAMVDLLLRVQRQDRTVIEFQKRGGKIHALDITDHVEALEDTQ